MRSVLHIDMNACYASIECLYDPAIRNLPVAVGGNVRQAWDNTGEKPDRQVLRRQDR